MSTESKPLVKRDILVRLEKRKARELRTLAEFISVYCEVKHRDAPKYRVHAGDSPSTDGLLPQGLALCEGCRKLLAHGAIKLATCSYDPKPSCKKLVCEVVCSFCPSFMIICPFDFAYPLYGIDPAEE